MISIYLMLASLHFGGNYNEVNPGFVMDVGNVSVGAYRNSHSRNSSVLAYRVPVKNIGDSKFEVVVGHATGYNINYVASIRWDYKQHSFYIVPATKYNSGVVGYAVRIM